MSDFDDGSTLCEAITGKWHRLEQGVRKGTFMVEFSDSLLLNIHVNTKNVDMLMKDKEGIFRYMGDISFSGLDEEGKLMLHSLAIDHIHFNNHNVQVANPETNISSIYVKLDYDKRIESEKKLLGE